MLTQLPRLTNSLRDHFGVNRAYLQRKDVLRNIKSRRSRDDLELARRLIHRWDDVPSDVRQAYRQFLGSVQKLIDGEFSSDEFQEVAIFIYGLFSVPDIDLKRRVFEKKGELQKLVGYSAQDSSLQNAAELAHRLYMLQHDDHESESTWTGIAYGCGDAIEFGSDIAFKVPARFLVDVPLENGTTSSGDGNA